MNTTTKFFEENTQFESYRHLFVTALSSDMKWRYYGFMTGGLTTEFQALLALVPEPVEVVCGSYRLAALVVHTYPQLSNIEVNAYYEDDLFFGVIRMET